MAVDHSLTGRCGGGPAANETQYPPVRRRRVIFGTVAVALLMGSIDSTIVATALHSIQEGLHTSVVWAGWTISAYALGQVLMLSTSGRLSDYYGRRRVFIASIVVFTLASLCCGLVSDIHLLIVLRGVQALGGAGFTPSATGIVVDNFGDARDRAVGLFGSIFPAGAVIGPIVGGVLVTSVSWRAIFLVNVPVGLVLLWLCMKFIPRDAAASTTPRRHLDGVGMVQLGVTVITGTLGLSIVGSGGASLLSAPFLLLELVAVLGVMVFVRHARRDTDPFIPARLIYGRGFGITNSVNFLFGGATAGLGSLVPLYATDRYHIDALGSGTLLTARSIATIVLSALAVYALRRTGYRWPLFTGLAVTAAGFFVMAIAPVGISAYAWLSIAAGITGIGLGWSGPASRNASLQLEPTQAASIASLRTTCRQSGSIVAVSITTAILARSADPGHALGLIFAVFAVILVLFGPFISRIPEHRGSW